MQQRRLVLGLVLIVSLVCAAAPRLGIADQHHILWEVKGRHNTVYLLGSVHVLKPGDSAVPAEALRAYSLSRILVLELDLSATDMEQSLVATTAELAMLPEGETLASALGPELYAKFKVRAAAAGLDADLIQRFQPWFAAMSLEQAELLKAGFDIESGVDMQFAQRAQTDGKQIVGLETLEDQLGIFAHLTAQQQRDYVRATLAEADTNANEANEIVRAWQSGDTVKLQKLLREETRESPELFRKLTVDRNRKWLPRIEQMLADDDNYLVIVGALHLIGHDGVIDLLQRDGYAPLQQ